MFRNPKQPAENKPRPFSNHGNQAYGDRAQVYEEIVKQIDLMLRARYSLLYVVTAEEEPIEEVLSLVASVGQAKRRVFYWDIVRGWSDNGADKGSIMGALTRVGTPARRSPLEANANPGDRSVDPLDDHQNAISNIYVLRDLHPILKNPATPANMPTIRELKNLARQLKRDRNMLVLTSHALHIPNELAEEITVLDFPLPDEKEISYQIRQKIAPDKLKIEGLAWEQLVKACQGLSRTRIERVLAKAIAAKQQVDDTDIENVLDEKKQAIRQTGILEFYKTSESLKSVGGLENLKQWVRIRKDAFTEEAKRYGIPTPKGVLLVGIQGTGKSLSAKTIAHEWRLPLLRLDTGRLFGGIVGESESRVRQMIQLSEAVAPCVLWIDEIDKAFGNVSSGMDGDSGTSRRVFGSLITWMQEKTSPVFIVATANNVEILPAELLRKGRFDEIFFLNLPTKAERQEIFRVHLQKFRPTRVRDFDMELLARQTRNFSGAEIEQVIIDAIHYAFGHGLSGQRRDFTTTDITYSIKETVPLAAIARDQIEALKWWAAEAGARTASNDVELTEELRQFSRKRGIDNIDNLDNLDDLDNLGDSGRPDREDGSNN
ncbi:AAA ATPase central domain protein [Thalassoporum mexicanum PCC 7367]|uniref:AAA family ATPase n=1 Tax=Thalassoporum mexicanum TaxID=3457544 RepID=UPI00029FB9DB|nr:AAA family ATPase [Pseudanabaena sp. PCC 7367]AFY70939.1 AAA ATPase central domain protein [Pseudanabaena sp. PCC 7367]